MHSRASDLERSPGGTVNHRLAACLCVCIVTAGPIPASADGAAEMQKKLQDPLANIKAIMTDNVIGFDTGNTDGTSYGFQLQPVYAIDFPDRGFTFINRAVFPIMGLEPGTDTRLPGQPDPRATDGVWGLGDTVYQGFFAPHTDAGWKWGAGPQISLPTATDSCVLMRS